MDNINNQITEYSKALRLPVFRRDYKELALEAAKDRIDYEEYLLKLMEREWEAKSENRKKSQIRNARFPSKMYLTDLEREQLPQGAREKLPLLERLDFIASAQNVILAGNPGTGKTHIAIGLGLKACMQGYKVLFTTVHRLITQLRESQSERTLKMVVFEKWLVNEYSKVLPKSPIGKAIKYCYDIYHRLSRYHLDGRYHIDNNLAENSLRGLALGRKNYLFCGNHDAAEDAAVIYSLLGCCKAADVNFRDWMVHVLSHIHDYDQDYSMDLAELLPLNHLRKTS